MGRNKECGLNYFPFDIDTFQDIKIRKLIKYQGGKAITVYALLLCIIYKDGYYVRWDEELPFIVSEQTGFEEAYIQEVIKSCLALGLFSKELFDSEKVLTSKGIQKRYQDITKLCRRMSILSEFNLISSEEIAVSSEEKPITSEESTQSKVKERKVKEIIFPSPPLKGGGMVKKKSSKEINSKARSLFEEHFKKTFSESYYWTAKDAGAMSNLLQKLTFSRQEKKMNVDDNSVLYALQVFLSSIKDGWIFENFSVTNLNSKYNEIVSQARRSQAPKVELENVLNEKFDGKSKSTIKSGTNTQLDRSAPKDYTGHF